jgi:hypothetical protein
MMRADLEVAMFRAGSTAPPDVITWRLIIAELLADFSLFLGEPFQRDEEPMLDVEGPTFAQWIWSELDCANPLSLTWCAVISGDKVDNAGDNSFRVTACLFLFHQHSHKRFVTVDGESYLLFEYSCQSATKGRWISLGWCEDEWREWEDVRFPGRREEDGPEKVPGT